MLETDIKTSKEYIDKALAAFDELESRKGKGNEFLGWLDLPAGIPESVIEDCEAIAEEWNAKSIQTVVVLGIGGSYLGAKAAISALSHTFSAQVEPKRMQVVFAGNNLCEEYHAEVMDYLSGRSFATVVISKSGTTIETSVAFRIIKNYMEDRYGREETSHRIVAITDRTSGALKYASECYGYRTFVIPDNVGGRFSILTPVGLLPIALAGFDIRKLLQGAAAMAERTSERSGDNPAVQYAAARNELYNSGKKIEMLVTYNPKLHYIGEWWKQLFGESEGKDGKGIFPATSNFTTDLHSMGQYIQQGERTLFETVISVKKSNRKLVIEDDGNDFECLNYLEGKCMDFCNHMAQIGTSLAHEEGGVPNLKIEIERINEYNLGELFFFFEKACGISAYMLGVNPFNQPGVEDYKVNMFALLGNPSYEKEAKIIAKKLK